MIATRSTEQITGGKENTDMDTGTGTGTDADTDRGYGQIPLTQMFARAYEPPTAIGSAGTQAKEGETSYQNT